MAVSVRMVYWRLLSLLCAILSEMKPATKTMAMSAIHGKEAQIPMDFKDKPCTSVRYRGSQAKKTYII